MPHDPKKLLESYQQAKTDRKNWEHLWDRVARYILPSREFGDNTAESGSVPGGENRRRYIFDSTAPKAALRLASGLHGLLMNPAMRWFVLRVAEPEGLNSDIRVRRWLDRNRDLLLERFNRPSTGFATSSFEVLLDAVAFGTGVMVNHEQPGTRKRMLRSLPLNDIFAQANDEDHIDRVYRRMWLTENQVRTMFGDENGNVDQEIERMIGSGSMGIGNKEKHEFVHVVFRNADYPGVSVNESFPWSSSYIHAESGVEVQSGGFRRNPYHIVRFSKSSGEVFGRGPGINQIDSVSVLNAMRKTELLAGEKALDPPLIVPADGVEGHIRTTPGSIIYTRMGQNRRIETLPPGQVAFGLEMVREEREEVRGGFFEDLLQLPDLDRATTLEVQQRANSQQQLLSPIISRLSQEFLAPVVESEYEIAAREGLFEPPPVDLSNARLKVEFISPLALSQKAGDVTSFNQMLATIGPLIEIQPEVMDKFEFDQIVDTVSEALSVNPNIVATDQEADAKRQQRAQAQAQQQQLQAVEQVAKASRDGASALKDLQQAGP